MNTLYQYEQLHVEDVLQEILNGACNKTERARRVLSYLRAGRLKLPKLAREAQQRALRHTTPPDLYIYIAPCGRGINKLGFTQKPVQRHQQLRSGYPRVVGFYSAVWLVQKGNARQIEAWSHALAHAIFRDPKMALSGEYHMLPSRLLADIVVSVARWLDFTIVRVVPALHF